MQRAKQISESIELGAILALAGGFMDAYSYIGRGGVFANAQTGNILLVGIHLSLGEFFQAARFLFPVLSFALGIMLSDLIHERFSSLFHWRQVTVLLEALILFAVSFIAADLNLLANCLTSFACGMQVESARFTARASRPPCVLATCVLPCKTSTITSLRTIEAS